MEEQEPISAIQERAIAALLRNRTKDEASRDAGVPQSTLYRWLREPEFKARLREAQRDLFDHAMGYLQDATGEAVATLRAVMTSDDAPETARVTAARLVIEFNRQHIDTHDLEERIAALEATIKNTNSHQG